MRVELDDVQRVERLVKNLIFFFGGEPAGLNKKIRTPSRRQLCTTCAGPGTLSAKHLPKLIRYGFAPVLLALIFVKEVPKLTLSGSVPMHRSDSSETGCGKKFPRGCPTDYLVATATEA
jgi:hypothetical protein